MTLMVSLIKLVIWLRSWFATRRPAGDGQCNELSTTALHPRTANHFTSEDRVLQESN